MVTATDGIGRDRTATISRRGYLTATAGALVGFAGCATDSSSSGSPGGTSDAETVTILLTPETPTDVKADYLPMRTYLEDEIPELNVEYRVPTDYSAILPALESKQAEIGMDDITLIAAPEQLDVLGSAVTAGTAFYFSLILTTPDSGIDSIGDIEGKTIAFADALSTSGSIYPLSELQRAGMSLGDAPGSDDGADFEGSWSNHEAALQQLRNGKADACATWGDIAIPYIPESKLPDRVKEQTAYLDAAGSESPALEPVWFSDPIPKQPVYARSSWNSETKETIKTALIDATAETMDEYKPDDYDGTMPFSTLRDTSIEDYQPVIDRVNGLGIDLTQEA